MVTQGVGVGGGRAQRGSVEGLKVNLLSVGDLGTPKTMADKATDVGESDRIEPGDPTG